MKYVMSYLVIHVLALYAYCSEQNNSAASVYIFMLPAYGNFLHFMPRIPEEFRHHVYCQSCEAHAGTVPFALAENRAPSTNGRRACNFWSDNWRILSLFGIFHVHRVLYSSRGACPLAQGRRRWRWVDHLGLASNVSRRKGYRTRMGQWSFPAISLRSQQLQYSIRRGLQCHGCPWLERSVRHAFRILPQADWWFSEPWLGSGEHDIFEEVETSMTGTAISRDKSLSACPISCLHRNKSA